MSLSETYELYLRVADEDETSVYVMEHWFFDAPDTATVALLFEDARAAFDVLYPAAEPADYSVEIRRLRPVQVHGPRAGEFPTAA